MEISLIRTKFLSDRTVGALHINDRLFCDTMEPARNQKVYGLIPPGEYTITLSVQSPRFLQVSTYKSINARLPRLLNVRGRDGILIHIGNYPEDTKGCILVGQLAPSTDLQNSRNTFFQLYSLMQQARSRGESIKIFVI